MLRTKTASLLEIVINGHKSSHDNDLGDLIHEHISIVIIICSLLIRTTASLRTINFRLDVTQKNVFCDLF